MNVFVKRLKVFFKVRPILRLYMYLGKSFGVHFSKEAIAGGIQFF